MRFFDGIACMCLTAAIVGCGGSSNRPQLMPVSGRVTLDGKPASDVMIAFVPIGSTCGVGASGCTDGSGNYELTAAHGGKGTPVGDYRVTAAKLSALANFDSPASGNAGHAKPFRLGMPNQWSGPHGALLMATVHDGSNTIDFSLSSKP